MDLSRIILGVITVAAVIFSALIITYACVFWNTGSVVSTESWSHFGSFIGGLMGPIFGFLSVVAVLYATRAQITASEEALNTQLDEIKSKSNIENILARMSHLEQTILNDYFQPKFSPMLIFTVPFIEESYLKIGTKDEIKVTDKGEFFEVNKLIFPKKLNSIELLQAHVQLVTQILKNDPKTKNLNDQEIEGKVNTYVKELVMTRNELTCAHHIKSIAAFTSYLVDLSQELVDKKVPVGFLKYQMSQFFPPARLLNKYGLFDETRLKVLSFYSCLPEKGAEKGHINQEVKVNVYNWVKVRFPDVGNIEDYKLDVEFTENYYSIYKLMGTQSVFTFNALNGECKKL